MPNVVIQPCTNPDAQEHYRNTIATPVPMERLAKHLSPAEMAELRRIYGSQPVPTWGTTPGKSDVSVAQWKKIAPSDLTLFTRSGEVFASAAVTTTARSAPLARELWGEADDKQTWEYLYFLSDVQPRAIPYDVLRHAGGLSPNWNPLRMWVMDPQRSLRILTAIGEQPIAGPEKRGGEELVKTATDVRKNVVTFSTAAASGDWQSRIRELLSQTTYWVYDPELDSFGPSKFAGIRDMTFSRYEQLLQLAQDGSVAGFDGHGSRTAIERAVGTEFFQSDALAGSLRSWGDSVLGDNSLGGADSSKWRFLSIPSAARRPTGTAPGSTQLADLAKAARSVANNGQFNPTSIDDAREKALSLITRRRGQPLFRRMVLAAYGDRCAISGCEAIDALEAAHISPYRGPETNHPCNGLPLRADLHTLFDLGLLAVDPDKLEVLMAPRLRATQYGVYAGRKIHLPGDVSLRPSRESLREHLEGARLR